MGPRDKPEDDKSWDCWENTMRIAIALVFVASLAAPAFAGQDQVDTEAGTLNPEQLTIRAITKNHDFSQGSLTYCTYGMVAAKTGDYVASVDIFQKCADRGSDPSSVWMSFMTENGFGVAQSNEAAAAWAKKAADRGFKPGLYDYGLFLMEGKGVPKDVEAGKRLIDQAAAMGFPAAQQLVKDAYNVNKALPDPAHAAMRDQLDPPMF